MRNKSPLSPPSVGVPNARECSCCGGTLSYSAAATCRKCYLACCKLTWGPNTTSYTVWMHGIRNLDVDRFLASERPGT